MDWYEHWLFVLLGGMAKWTRGMFRLLCYYALVLEERLTEGVEIVPLPEDSTVASLAFSVEKLGHTYTGNTAFADAIMDMGEHRLFVLLGGMAKWPRDMFRLLCYYALVLEERLTEEVEIVPLSEGSNVVASLVSSADVIINLGERSEYVLFVGAAEWTRDPRDQEDEDDYELFVEVKVGGSREVHRTMSKETAHWDEYIRITGYLSSIVRIEIKSVAHNSSESLSVVRVETSLENLLEICADGDPVLGLAIAPLVSGMVDPATGTGGLMGSQHSAPDSIGLITIKLFQLSHGPPNLLQLRDTFTVSVPQLEQRIPEEFGDDLMISRSEQALALDPGHAASLSNLGHGYSMRFDRLGDLADLEISIASSEKAVRLAPDSHFEKPIMLTALGYSYHKRFKRLGHLADLDNWITTRQQALALARGPPGLLLNLSFGYSTRFDLLGDLADLENSIASLQEAVRLAPDSHPQKSYILTKLGLNYQTRFDRLGDLADIEIANTTLQQAIALTSDHNDHKPALFSNLGLGYQKRFKRLGDLADLENSVASLQEALRLAPDSHHQKSYMLTNLSYSYHLRVHNQRLGDVADFENSIVSCEQALALTPDDDPKKSAILSQLGLSYSARSRRLGDPADLEYAIAILEKAVALAPDDHPDKSHNLNHLSKSYHLRFHRLQDPADLNNAMMTMKLAAQSPGVSPIDSLAFSRDWASLSLQSIDIPSALQAFRTAIELLPQVAWLGLDIATQQAWLAKEKPEELGCMAATCAIRLGRLEDAVELLDMARSVFWQQASSVRSGLRDLKAGQPKLAKELETVSHKLDTSSFSGLSTASSDMDPELYGRRLADHRGLVLKRESLIKTIRLFPGFEFFFKPTPFNRLRDAAAAGRVVIINISKLGTDALIFDRTNPIRHAHLCRVNVAKSFKHTSEQKRADDTHDQERSLMLPEVLNSIDVDTLKPGQETDLTTSDGIMQRQGRADVTEEHQSSRTLFRVWERILKPIFTEVGIPLQGIQDEVPTNRIFWYLTGPLTFIPIHAAGPVSQLVVSSYVTTLSSLAEAQKRHRESIGGPPRLLAITQPDTPGQTAIPYATDEVNSVLETLSAKGWRQGNLQRFDRANATIDQVSTALDSCSWVHFACHAMQHASDGMESAFALHDGRLKLSVIAAKRLTSAQFAFLSTCQSASGLEDSPGEAMHLSAGMQFAGFSSVIATMSSIRDEDAPIVANHTYEYLLRNGLDKIDLTEAAAALSYAVSRLREDPTVTVERWAPFVHYGV